MRNVSLPLSLISFRGRKSILRGFRSQSSEAVVQWRTGRSGLETVLSRTFLTAQKMPVSDWGEGLQPFEDGDCGFVVILWWNNCGLLCKRDVPAPISAPGHISSFVHRWWLCRRCLSTWKAVCSSSISYKWGLLGVFQSAVEIPVSRWPADMSTFPGKNFQEFLCSCA